MGRIVNDEALDTLFRAARRPHRWLAQPVGDTLLRALWELVKLGPTSGDGPPARLVLIRSQEAKVRLDAMLSPAARAVIAAAPVVAILGRRTGPLPPAAGARDATLRAASLILAARALGLDCAPLWEFDGRPIADVFFPDGAVDADFVCALGYGDELRTARDAPPVAAGEACIIL